MQKRKCPVNSRLVCHQLAVPLRARFASEKAAFDSFARRSASAMISGGSRHFIWMIHAHCLPIGLIDFFQAGILRDAKHFPPLAASVLSLGPLSVVGRLIGSRAP